MAESLDSNFVELLGIAVAKCWGDFPQEIQQKIYEAAVAAGCGDDNDLFREQLAVYLHNHHPRTGRATSMPRDLPRASGRGSDEVETELNSRSWKEDRDANGSSR